MGKFEVWTQVNDYSSAKVIEAETAKKALKIAKKRLKDELDGASINIDETSICVFDENGDGDENGDPLAEWLPSYDW